MQQVDRDERAVMDVCCSSAPRWITAGVSPTPTTCNESSGWISSRSSTSFVSTRTTSLFGPFSNLRDQYVPSPSTPLSSFQIAIYISPASFTVTTQLQYIPLCFPGGHSDRSLRPRNSRNLKRITSFFTTPSPHSSPFHSLTNIVRWILHKALSTPSTAVLAHRCSSYRFHMAPGLEREQYHVAQFAHAPLWLLPRSPSPTDEWLLTLFNLQCKACPPNNFYF